jgi:hypothetical protein
VLAKYRIIPQSNSSQKGLAIVPPSERVYGSLHTLAGSVRSLAYVATSSRDAQNYDALSGWASTVK